VRPSSCFMRANIKELTFEDDSVLHRIEAKCFCDCHLKTICMAPFVEELGNYLSADANIRTLRIYECIKKLSPDTMKCFLRR
jgi:hypothetical protein